LKSLTAEQQAALAARAKSGDKKATSALLAFCERDIVAIVRHLKCGAGDVEDVQQVARMTVLKAIQKFDANAGMQFRFYAAKWAKEDARRHVNSLSSIVRHNVHTRSRDVSLDAHTYRPDEHEDGEPMLDRLESDLPSPEKEMVLDCEAQQLRIALTNIVRRLNNKTRRKYDRQAMAHDLVFKRMLSSDPLSFDDLAAAHKVARETVRKLEVAILKLAKCALQEV
jgi:RNA polymerase sigma factor (sigma-70 family)